MTTLPIDALLPELVATLQRREALVLEAPPGAGKALAWPIRAYSSAALVQVRGRSGLEKSTASSPNRPW